MLYRRAVCRRKMKDLRGRKPDRSDQSWWSSSTNNLCLRCRNPLLQIPLPRHHPALRRSTWARGLPQSPRKIEQVPICFSWLDGQSANLESANRSCVASRQRQHFWTHRRLLQGCSSHRQLFHQRSENYFQKLYWCSSKDNGYFSAAQKIK